jgi:hypothetical protein
MPHKYTGGCDHIETHADDEPVDNHTCHCSVCKRVTGQPATHVVFFRYDDLKVDKPNELERQPFNSENPDGPLELCTCETCGQPIMLDDRQHRIRAIVPNLMGYDDERLAASYHAFFDPAAGVPRPDDGRPVHPGLRPEFTWPEPT